MNSDGASNASTTVETQPQGGESGKSPKPSGTSDSEKNIKAFSFVALRLWILELIRYALLITAVFGGLAIALLAIDNRAASQLNDFGMTADARVTAVDGNSATLSFREVGGSIIHGDVKLPEGQELSPGDRIDVLYDLAKPGHFLLKQGIAERIINFKSDIVQLTILSATCLIVALLIGEVATRALWRKYDSRGKEAYRG